jgi:hypothetical protein
MADPILKRGDRGPRVIEAQDLLNRNGAILEADGDFGGGTEAAVREFQAAAAPSLSVTGVIDDATWQALQALPEPSSDIPVRTVAFIGREEVGGRELYDKVGCRPTWPGGASGVTIGVGYDLGQEASFESDWSMVLTPDQMTALRPWVQVQGERAAAGPAALNNIAIPWRATCEVFIRRSLPDQVKTARTAFHGWKRCRAFASEYL